MLGASHSEVETEMRSPHGTTCRHFSSSGRALRLMKSCEGSVQRDRAIDLWAARTSRMQSREPTRAEEKFSLPQQLLHTSR